ncbi:uncharacterized protein NPIL_211741 [Nephila pilipes]|uniref:Uncharacterized protein n=1 Tax=Nephila pilipes TaxID=299642 RepID=A0A8X6MV70_NEPPI|nr:uncharacterized protein NPIL_211741 [Nephila pilipes]
MLVFCLVVASVLESLDAIRSEQLGRHQRDIGVAMALSRLPVLSLRQMAMLKIAIRVCNDNEIQDFVKENGSLSFVFPSKETQVYLEKAGILLEQTSKWYPDDTWAWRDFLKDTKFDDMLSYTMNKELEDSGGLKMTKGILPFKGWEALVEKKLSVFLLPPLLRSELVDVIRSIFAEIDKWIKDHSPILLDSSETARIALCHFQWNSLGKIDRVKTARTIIRIEKLHIDDPYNLALHYGLMEDMLPDRMKDILCAKCLEKYDYIKKISDSRTYGTWFAFTEESHFNHFAQRNFFTESSPEKKLECLITVMSMECIQYEDFLFCLSQMSEYEKTIVFIGFHYKILMYFLDWPLQCEFMDAAKRLLPYFTVNDFRDILKVILYERVMLGRRDFNYIVLLKEFWSISPSPLKQFIEKDPLYKNLIYTINFSTNEIFPNEQLFEDYHGNNFDQCSDYHIDNFDLTFGYPGMKYYLVRTKEPSNFFEALQLVLNAYYYKYRFGNIFCICKERRKKPEQKFQSQIKLRFTDFISKLQLQKFSC